MPVHKINASSQHNLKPEPSPAALCHDSFNFDTRKRKMFPSAPNLLVHRLHWLVWFGLLRIFPFTLGGQYGISCVNSTATVRRTCCLLNLGLLVSGLGSSVRHRVLRSCPTLHVPPSITLLHRPETSFITIPPLLFITHRTF